MSLDVQNERTQTYYSLKGDLAVQWEADRMAARTIETQQLRVLARQGKPVFRKKIEFDREDDVVPYLPMLMTWDLNHDGLSEIIVPSTNAVYWNRGNWNFERAKLVNAARTGEMLVGLLSDFTGDGTVDLLTAVKSPRSAGELRSNLILYVAGEDGGLSDATTKLIGDSILYHPMAMSAGDIDADGDLDVFVGQYKSPYKYGQMPTPYYDANDGYPAYLLLNDGEGGFVDVTELAGLAAKRLRRTYGASFVDLDGDNDLDLAVASDFSGLDVYLNDGSGKFADVSEEFVDNRHSFGMSLTFGDYDLNSKPDFLMVGMSSTTARRLDQLGLGREQFPEHQEFRRKMGYGNRMYLAGESTFKQPTFNDQVARTGWSWGATSFDFDNDGDRDIYIANGHVSGNTCKDYCSTYWRHDIYEGSSEENPRMYEFFKVNIANELRPISWNGFEHNVLLSNQQGQGFLSIGFLAGVATECDSRNVISDDLDGDGRMDLVVVARENGFSPYTVRVYRNEFESQSNWIGLRLEDTPGSGLGAQVTAKTPQGETFTTVVTCGDSFKSQHAPVVHFGLGSHDAVEEITVQWPQSEPRRIMNPAINQYHDADSLQ
ncbi:MAG: CRTAC1 family protein [Planctomycetaceae bacterium]